MISLWVILNNKIICLEVINMKKTIEIHGMSCGHCEAHVKKELEALAGVESAEASAADKNAIVNLSKDVAESKLKLAVEKAGYEFIKVVE